MTESMLEMADEQLAPFDKPDEADVRLIRMELERNKRRCNEASPVPALTGNGGVEL